MTYKNTGGPAFPTVTGNYANENAMGEGMTLRDYFAAKAMRALMASNGLVFGTDLNDQNNKNRNIARIAYAMADAMIEARQS